MVRKQPDGTYRAEFNGEVRFWPTKKQAANWVQRRKNRELIAADYDGDFVNRLGVRTVAEVAKIMGMSHTRVQQIERLALRKMRATLRDDGTEKEWFEQ